MRVRSGAVHQRARETAYRYSTYIDIDVDGKHRPYKNYKQRLDALTYIKRHRMNYDIHVLLWFIFHYAALIRSFSRLALCNKQSPLSVRYMYTETWPPSPTHRHSTLVVAMTVHVAPTSS